MRVGLTTRREKLDGGSKILYISGVADDPWLLKPLANALRTVQLLLALKYCRVTNHSWLQLTKVQVNALLHIWKWTKRCNGKRIDLVMALCVLIQN